MYKMMYKMIYKIIYKMMYKMCARCVQSVMGPGRVEAGFNP